MIIERPTTRSTTLYESLILMIVVESLSMINTTFVGCTKPIHTKMAIMIDILVV